MSKIACNSLPATPADHQVERYGARALGSGPR